MNNKMNSIEGNFVANDLKIAIVVSRFNEFITMRLKDGAIDCLKKHGCPENNITVVEVPGAFEIPVICQELAQSGTYQGIIALGAVIRGATAHFDFVAGEVAKGISRVSLKNNLPVAFGVLTTDTIEQAIERAGSKAGNKGWEAAQTVIETATLLKEIRTNMKGRY